MKLHLVFAFAALCAAVPAASAQSRITVDVPFSFTVGDKECPAGVWKFEQSGTNRSLYTIRSRDGKHFFMMMLVPSRESAEPGPAEVVFHRYGAVSFLSEIRGSSGTGSRVVPGAAEKDLVAAGRQPEKAVYVLALSK
ncbi:MAG: hypothetical protein ACPL7M_06545 [Bryobacteraceae bacterium]